MRVAVEPKAGSLSVDWFGLAKCILMAGQCGNWSQLQKPGKTNVTFKGLPGLLLHSLESFWSMSSGNVRQLLAVCNQKGEIQLPFLDRIHVEEQSCPAT